MIYPNNFEEKIEFNQVRQYINSYCVSSLGIECLNDMHFMIDIEKISISLHQTMEFVSILQNDDFPQLSIFDLRQSFKRIHISDTFLSTQELFDLYRSLSTLNNIINYLCSYKESGNNNEYKYPYLQLLTVDKQYFPDIYKHISIILNEFGEIRDTASADLSRIRKEKLIAEKNVSKVLHYILKNAQKEGYVDINTSPAVRDGRLVIPMPPAYKRKISGIVHDESDSGKTVYVEPTQVVEANNQITELENEERKEIIRILKNITKLIRPHIDEILDSFSLLANVDFIRAKAKFAIMTDSHTPIIHPTPLLQWYNAIHPLLKIVFDKKNIVNQSVVPLDIELSNPKQRILLISGPNAGGKSVCLKTVGLLQYMLQCGMPVPVSIDSNFGIFHSIFINIGDEQSIENELSTFSSHLLNMRAMMRYSNQNSLLLIDEFGGGTEPMIGGALAQSILRKLNNNKTFAIITTHFQNLKQYAQETDGIINAAMLYDRGEMRPLFQLRIGTPGSSFAIEIAKKIGIPKEVIAEAESIVGNDYISSDKYIQDIIRDKRYWEKKRNEIHQKEKRMEQIISQYEEEITKLKKEKKQIIDSAKEEATAMLANSNAMIERTIKEIKTAQAEKEQTKQVRKNLEAFKEEISSTDSEELDDYIQRQIEKIKNRQKRKAAKRGKKDISQNPNKQVMNPNQPAATILKDGDYVKMKDQQTVGRILKVNNERNEALVVFGTIQMNIKTDRLEISSRPVPQKRNETFISRETQENIRETKLNFKTEIDIRGMRADEALQAMTYFIDDALVSAVSRVRILHGTGSGILRNVIRDYLSTIPNVSSYHDEHPQFGGAGITIVEFTY